jgi:hypothetical protein
MLENEWTEGWERSDAPDPVPMPLQSLVAIEAVGAGRPYPEKGKEVNFSPCGQVIGRAKTVRKARDVIHVIHVIHDLVEEYIEAVEPLAQPANVRAFSAKGSLHR